MGKKLLIVVLALTGASVLGGCASAGHTHEKAPTRTAVTKSAQALTEHRCKNGKLGKEVLREKLEDGRMHQRWQC